MSNDQRSNGLNPNNPAYRASIENKANQLNPDHIEYKGNVEEEEKESD